MTPTTAPTTPADPPRGFSTTELQQRTQRAQQKMAALGVCALLLTDEPNFRYFSGFHTQFWHSPTRPWCLIVPARGAPIAVIPSIGHPLMQTTWIDDIRVWQQLPPNPEWRRLLASALQNLNGDSIATPMSGDSRLALPLADFQRLQQDLRGKRFVDDNGLTAALRQIKSPAEVAKIQRAASAAAAAFAALPATARAGAPLRQVHAAFKQAALAAGADDVPYLAAAAAPDGYDDIIAPPTDAPLKKGDILMLDTGATYDGYFCDYDRNVAITAASDAARRLYDSLHAALEAGRAAARPGATCAQVFAAMQTVLTNAGYPADAAATGRMGHAIGMQLTEPPSIHPQDHTPLAAGMTLALEPFAAHAPARAMVHEENILIQEDQTRWLTPRAPATLPILAP